ncbi:MAG: winged helix DNA-binding domain-containing protein [Vicinamibacteraceae bacterium]
MGQNRQWQHAIALRRLRNQAIAGATRRTPADVVTWLGAVQAQEYGPAKWALALRMDAGTRDEDIERAFNAGRILRTHVMRPTWHFVPPEDIRWMLELTAPRVHPRMAPYNRKLELDARTFTRAAAVFERALDGRRFLTRRELAEQLARADIPATGQRLGHLVMYAELERVMCSGPRRGKQFTYALLAERAPRARRLARDEALGTLARRFFRSHGPATTRDFVWWSGLLTSDAKRGLEVIRARPETCEGLTYWSLKDARTDGARDDTVHLLPVYDEYLVAYRDREAVRHWPPGVPALEGRLTALHHPVVIRGHVAGLWRMLPLARGGGRIEVVTAAPLGRDDRAALHAAAARYAAAVGVPVSVAFL